MRDRAGYYDALVKKSTDGSPVDFGATIKSLRTNVTGMTQVEFARACKIDVKVLRQIEVNKIAPPIDLLEYILGVFGLQLTIGMRKRASWRFSDRRASFPISQ